MTFRSVILGVDFSPGLEGVGSWLKTTFAREGCLTLVHAFEPPHVPRFLRAFQPDEQSAFIREVDDATTRLEGWRDAQQLAKTGAIVQVGRPDAVLRETARQCAADLVAIGGHFENVPPWRRLGTTAERLLRTAETSLLVIRGRLSDKPARILVAADDVGITPYVLTTAAALSARFGAELRVVHVLSNAAYSHILSIEAAQAQNHAEAERRVQADVDEEALRWLKDVWQHTSAHERLAVEVPHGNAADEILRISNERSVDLIVIGRYGAGRAIPAFLGSVVGSVVAGAPCPVLVVSEPPNYSAV